MARDFKETSVNRIDQEKYRENYDRIFGKDSPMALTPRKEPANDTVKAIAGKSIINGEFIEAARERVEELENLLNESQTARQELIIENARLNAEIVNRNREIKRLNEKI